MSNINLENERIVITEKYNTAIALLNVRKQALIAKVTDLVENHNHARIFLRTTLELTDTDQDNDPSDNDPSYTVQNIANYEYQEYIQAVKATHLWRREIAAVDKFQATHDKLLSIVQNQELSEKTKVAVRELIQYIDQHIEPSLWNMLFGKTSWDMLVKSLDETCSLIEEKNSVDQIDWEEINDYTTYLNTVDGKPNKHSLNVLLIIMPLLPALANSMYGSFTGVALFNIWIIAIGFVLSLAGLYFSVQLESNTGLSKKNAECC